MFYCKPRNDILANQTLLAIVLTITQGMLLYIVIFELLPHVKHNDDKRGNIIAVVLGVLTIIISHLL